MEVELKLWSYAHAKVGATVTVRSVSGRTITYDNSGYNHVLTDSAEDVALPGDLVTFLRPSTVPDQWFVEITRGNSKVERTKKMTGKIYDAVVVRTKTVPARRGSEYWSAGV